MLRPASIAAAPEHHMPELEPDHLPTWVESTAVFTTGIDLLGLRQSVQLIGGQLLDGITTVTPYVRYLSLRAWLVYRYGQTGGPDAADAFTAFCLRVESGMV